jgi:fatty-acyl-CoA synthase
VLGNGSALQYWENSLISNCVQMLLFGGVGTLTGFLMIEIPYDTLAQAILSAPDHRPFITMWRDEDEVETVTFGDFRQAAHLQAAEFIKQGVRLGDRIILVMPQGIPLMVSFAAAMLSGAIPAIIAYPNFKIEPAKYRFGLSGVSKNLKARLIVLDEGFPKDLLNYVAHDGDVRIIRNVAYDNSAPPARITPAFPEQTRIDPAQIAFIQHSAGTTGLQKGVALSHASVLRQLRHLAAALRLSDEDRIYSWLPLYHDMGLIACFMLPLASHLPAIMQSPTDWIMRPASMLSLITRYRCTLAWIPNFALQFLARRVPDRDRSQFDLSSLRMLINCSEPVRQRSIDEFCTAYAAYGFRRDAHQSCYAMAENVFALTQSGIGERTTPKAIWVDSKRLAEEHIAFPVEERENGAICLVSSGSCLEGNRFRIVDADERDLPANHVGEIVLQSDSLFEGYFNRSDLTQRVLKDGWYYSGDLGFFHDDELFVIGRKSDLIIVGGKNLYPQDIEEIACSHPSVHDGRAVAFGLTNPDLGTEDIIVVAEVEDEGELIHAAQIEQAIRSAIVAELGVAVLAVYLKPPKWVVKSTAGKPARSTTRAKILAEHSELRGG